MQPTEKEFRSALKAYTAKHGITQTFILLKELTGQTAATQVKPERYAAVINAIRADARKHEPRDSRFTKIRKSARRYRKAIGQDA